MRRFVKETRIAAPPAQVFGFHESPQALTSLIPPWETRYRQRSGPIAMWEHRHEFHDDGAGGTILRDQVDDALPLGVLAHWVAGGFVERQIARLFAYRHETTKRIVESAG